MDDDAGADGDGAEVLAAAPVDLPGTPERGRGKRVRRGSARYLSDTLGSDDDEDGEALLDVGAVEERDGGDSGSDYEEAGRRGGAGGAPAVPARLQRPPGARAIKALSTDPHVLSPQRKCPYGCGALVWPKEGTVCCSAGKHILGAEYNPPIDASYMEILTMEHVSKDSRHLKAGLAMGTQGIFPSKAVGGLGWHEQGGWSHLSQEYALVQHSRQVEDTLNFQRFGGLQAKLKRRRDVNPREGQQGAGSRVALTASVVGSFK